MKKINIAIDGPSGVGKSTIAKKLAQELDLLFINTGLMYRAIGWYMINENLNFHDDNELKENLKKIKLELLPNEEISLNGQNITKSLYEDKISLAASHVAKNKDVRNYCVNFQQQIAKINPGVVMEGRDIGSIVLPNAELKIFLTASNEIRAKRRYEQLKTKGENITEKEIFKNLVERDNNDLQRKNSPLIKVEDAIEIDTSNLTLDEVIQKVISLAKSRMK